MYSFFTFSYTTNFEFFLRFLYFPREIFDIMYEDLLYGFYSLPFKFSGKVLPVILILLFFSFILYMPTRIFLSGANKKPFKSKNSIGRKCSQLKVLKVLLMHLFVTLLINNWYRQSEATIPRSTIQSSFKQVLVILQVYSVTVGWHKLEPWTNCPKKKW